MKTELTILVVAIALLALVGTFFPQAVSAPANRVACTLDAMICPDGTAVGRTGPDCAFAACPQVVAPDQAVSSSTETVVRLGQEVAVGTSLLVLEGVVEDSRCPIDVTCIQAGTVRVEGRVASSRVNEKITLELGLPVTLDGTQLLLVGVDPAPSSKATLKPSDYAFRLNSIKQ